MATSDIHKGLEVLEQTRRDLDACTSRTERLALYATVEQLITRYGGHDDAWIAYALACLLQSAYPWSALCSAVEGSPALLARFIALMDVYCSACRTTETASNIREHRLHGLATLLQQIRRHIKRNIDRHDCRAQHRLLLDWVSSHIEFWHRQNDACTALLFVYTAWVKLWHCCIAGNEPYIPAKVLTALEVTLLDILPALPAMSFTMGDRLLRLYSALLSKYANVISDNLLNVFHAVCLRLELPDTAKILGTLEADESDFCFDAQQRSWPPASLVRRALLCILRLLRRSTDNVISFPVTDYADTILAVMRAPHRYFAADDQQLFASYALLVHITEEKNTTPTAALPPLVHALAQQPAYTPHRLLSQLMDSIGWDVGLLLDWSTAAETSQDCITLLQKIVLSTRSAATSAGDGTEQLSTTLDALGKRLSSAVQHQLVPTSPRLLELLEQLTATTSKE